jgi:hypothetical protein
MSDRFHAAVVQIRAEQFFEEKAASARGGLSPVDFALFVKSASEMSKQAEPPPPSGVSAAEWDKILDKGPAKTVARVLDCPRARVTEVGR